MKAPLNASTCPLVLYQHHPQLRQRFLNIRAEKKVTVDASNLHLLSSSTPSLIVCARQSNAPVNVI